MVLFIALPIGSVFIQSLYIEHGAVLKEVKSCGPFGCKDEVQIDVAATSQLKEEKPLGKFNGFGTYTNRNHLAVTELKSAWNDSANWSIYFSKVYNLPFYRALAFTLTYTFIVTPLVLLLGFFIALGVNSLPKKLKGPTIFVSLLPMIVTPLIGSLILFWMIDSKGILGASLQWLLDDPNLSLKASPRFNLDNVNYLRCLAFCALCFHCLLRRPANCSVRNN